jgi:hypothetical protein
MFISPQLYTLSDKRQKVRPQMCGVGVYMAAARRERGVIP